MHCQAFSSQIILFSLMTDYNFADVISHTWSVLFLLRAKVALAFRGEQRWNNTTLIVHLLRSFLETESSKEIEKRVGNWRKFFHKS